MEPVEEGLFAGVARYDVIYEVLLDSVGPFRYHIYDPAKIGPTWYASRIKTLLGSENVVGIEAESGEDWMVRVDLLLESTCFRGRTEIVAHSPSEILEQVRELLPREHVLDVSLISASSLKLIERKT